MEHSFYFDCVSVQNDQILFFPTVDSLEIPNACSSVPPYALGMLSSGWMEESC